ncbi:efflux RND transporter periplasmic adaptor subunit [Collimonas sp.]|jgi:cobalt-zinc-cadmium efflux system membrane fusion protein|uniref:efflux RND transporter periplasmic adaptor subunit n=1 Tax=Collimonas sp. TaxID=1963772 RepID=UPI002CB4CD44|nr:efflux RND transporter periplasmic adaptor subunit [Collimonas sp.]HWW07844.1 efflux RND transporter periplasmic adaptor subunit [Collimonas sp.]
MNNLFSQRKSLAIAVVSVLIVGGLAFVESGSKVSAHAAGADNEAVANFIRQGDRITIPARSPLRQRLAVETVTALDAAHALELPAQVEADPARTINILPPVAGKVLELKVGLGDRVRKGQLLLVMTSGDFAQATSDLQKSRDAMQLTKRVLERQRGVQQAGAAAAKDLEQSESAYVQAQAEFARADTRLRSLSASGASAADSGGQRLNLIAPSSGSITTLAIGAGQSANDPNAVLMTIANLESVWITASVPENMLSSIKKGQAVNIGLPAYPGEQFHGNVSFVSDVLQADTRRALVRISVSNADGKFKPNMFANASFAVAQASAPAIPPSALLMNNENTTVFVETAPWTFVRRTIETGNEEDGSVRIVKGLQLGDRVVIKGGVLLND